MLSTARAERTMDLWMGTDRGADGLGEVTAAWTPRAAAGGAASGRPDTVSITVRGSGDEKIFEAPASAGQLSFSVPPGELQLRTLVRDRAGNTIDEDTRPLTVPDYAAAELAISAPALFRARNAGEARVFTGAAQESVPFAGREFVRTDRLFVRFAVYGRAPMPTSLPG